MALFNFGKKKEEKKAAACACCSADTAANKAETCCADLKEDGIHCIRVLGAGCKSCRELYENVKQAVKDTGLSAKVEYITDMQIIMEYGVMRMPALVVNEQVAVMGKVLKAADIVCLLQEFGA